MALRWSEDQLQEFLRSRGDAGGAVPEAMLRAGVPTVTEKKRKKPKADGTSEKSKRRGVEVGPIIDSLRTCIPKVKVTPGDLPSLAICFEGARVLTINELFSIMQYRKFEIIRYRKAWKTLVHRALTMIPPDHRVFFEGPVVLEVVRRGAKTLDDDGSKATFKYLIDALVRKAPKKKSEQPGVRGVLADDNRKVVVASKIVDIVGPPAIGIRIEAVAMHERQEEKDPMPSWFAG